MNKKGVELSVNVIIIAAISLIVLVLLAFLVLRGGGGLSTGTTCEALGGICKADPGECGDYSKYDITKTCSKESANNNRPYCCIPIG